MHLVGQKSDTSKRKMLYDIQSNTNQNLAIENFAKKKNLIFTKQNGLGNLPVYGFFSKNLTFHKEKCLRS
jgi:hypothetical protein